MPYFYRKSVPLIACGATLLTTWQQALANADHIRAIDMTLPASDAHHFATTTATTSLLFKGKLE